MSARLPAVSSSAARVSAYASTTHCSCEKLALSASWMSGRATFTIVMSSRSMNVPSDTATRVSHLFPSAGGAPRADGAGGRTNRSSILSTVTAIVFAPSRVWAGR